MWSNLARWPEWQKRIQNEIDNSPIICIEKFEHLPLLAAFFYETWRWMPIHHLSLLHCQTSKESFRFEKNIILYNCETKSQKIELEGYTFSKDTIFSMAFAGIQMNPKYFQGTAFSLC